MSVLCDGWHYNYDANGDLEPTVTDMRLSLDDDVIDIHVAASNAPLASIPVEAVARLLAEAVGR